MLSSENISLKKEVEKLKLLVDKLTLSLNKLELLLKDKKDSSNKAEIGYNFLNKNRISTTKFVSSNASTSTSRTTRYIPMIKYQKPVRTVIATSASHASIFYTTKHTYAPNYRIICYIFYKVGHKIAKCNMLKKSSHVINKIRQI